MTRDVKIGMVVTCCFLSLVTVVVITKMREKGQDGIQNTALNVPGPDKSPSTPPTTPPENPNPPQDTSTRSTKAPEKQASTPPAKNEFESIGPKPEEIKSDLLVRRSEEKNPSTEESSKKAESSGGGKSNDPPVVEPAKKPDSGLPMPISPVMETPTPPTPIPVPPASTEKKKEQAQPELQPVNKEKKNPETASSEGLPEFDPNAVGKPDPKKTKEPTLEAPPRTPDMVTPREPMPPPMPILSSDPGTGKTPNSGPVPASTGPAPITSTPGNLERSDAIRSVPGTIPSGIATPTPEKKTEGLPLNPPGLTDPRLNPAPMSIAPEKKDPASPIKTETPGNGTGTSTATTRDGQETIGKTNPGTGGSPAPVTPGETSQPPIAPVQPPIAPIPPAIAPVEKDPGRVGPMGTGPVAKEPTPGIPSPMPPKPENPSLIAPPPLNPVQMDPVPMGPAPLNPTPIKSVTIDPVPMNPRVVTPPNDGQVPMNPPPANPASNSSSNPATPSVGRNGVPTGIVDSQPPLAGGTGTPKNQPAADNLTRPVISEPRGPVQPILGQPSMNRENQNSNGSSAGGNDILIRPIDQSTGSTPVKNPRPSVSSQPSVPSPNELTGSVFIPSQGGNETPEKIAIGSQIETPAATAPKSPMNNKESNRPSSGAQPIAVGQPVTPGNLQQPIQEPAPMNSVPAIQIKTIPPENTTAGVNLLPVDRVYGNTPTSGKTVPTNNPGNPVQTVMNNNGQGNLDVSRPVPTPGNTYRERQLPISNTDTFESISKRAYGTDRYAAALKEYNKNHPAAGPSLSRGFLQQGETIMIPDQGKLDAMSPRSSAPTSGLGTSLRNQTIQQTGFQSVQPSANIQTAQGATYSVKGNNENFYTIARTLYGNGDRWSEIYELNKDRFQSMDVIPAGTLLTIPSTKP